MPSPDELRMQAFDILIEVVERQASQDFYTLLAHATAEANRLFLRASQIEAAGATRQAHVSGPVVVERVGLDDRARCTMCGGSSALAGSTMDVLDQAFRFASEHRHEDERAPQGGQQPCRPSGRRVTEQAGSGP